MFKDFGASSCIQDTFLLRVLGATDYLPCVLYFFPQIYSFFGLPTRQVTHPVQLYALIAWFFHYCKWEFETFFIHHLSHATSPLANLYSNFFYYWAFAAFIAYFVNHPLYTPVSKEQMYIGFAVSAVSQICTFYCHSILKNLRSPDGKGWIPDSIWVSLQLYYMCKLYNWIVSVDWIQYWHTDLDRLSVSWSCSLHHDCLGPSEAQTLEKGTLWIDCILPIFCTGLSIHDSAPQHRRNMSLQQKSMIKELWSVYISF